MSDAARYLRKELLAAREQQPVAWIVEHPGYRGLTFLDPQTAEGSMDGFSITPLYAVPHAGQEDKALDLLRQFVALVPEPPLTYSYDSPPEHRSQEEHELGYALHLARELLAAAPGQEGYTLSKAELQLIVDFFEDRNCKHWECVQRWRAMLAAAPGKGEK